MKYITLLLLFWISVLGSGASELSAQEHVYLPGNGSRIRALGMGAAFQAVRDDLAALSFNPANYDLYAETKAFRLTLFLSPITPVLIAMDDEAFFGRKAGEAERTYVLLASLIKGVNFTYKNLDVGLLIGEPLLTTLPEDASTRRFIHATRLYNNHYNALALRIKLAEQVAIGGAAYLVYFDDAGQRRQWDIGASYGITLQPSKKFGVGVSLFTAAVGITHSREFIDQIFNDAINVGVAYQPRNDFLLAVDVRNLGVGLESAGEMYLAGLEKSFFRQVALRFGVQYAAAADEISPTFGVSLIDLNTLWNRSRRFRHHNFALHYALIRKKMDGNFVYFHMFNAYFRF